MIYPELKAPPRAGGSNTEGPLSGLDVMGLSQGPVLVLRTAIFRNLSALRGSRAGGFLGIKEDAIHNRRQTQSCWNHPCTIKPLYRCKLNQRQNRFPWHGIAFQARCLRQGAKF